MNYQEAEEMAAQYRHLEGDMFRGKTISKFLIAPLKEVGIARLMYNLANDRSSEDFYQQYNDFEIWVMFDLENWEQTGVMDKMKLAVFLTEFNFNPQS